MLPRAARLRKERDFRAVFARPTRPDSGGRAASRPRIQSSPLLTVHVKPRRCSPQDAQGKRAARLRFGITVAKKVAKRAHDRNRLKRRLSEIARVEILPNYLGIAPDAPDMRCFDCVVVVRQPAVGAEFAALRAEFLHLLRAAGIDAGRSRPAVSDLLQQEL